MLCVGLFSHDPLSAWFASVAMLHAVANNAVMKEELLRVHLATTLGAKPVTLLQHCCNILAQVRPKIVFIAKKICIVVVCIFFLFFFSFTNFCSFVLLLVVVSSIIRRSFAFCFSREITVAAFASFVFGQGVNLNVFLTELWDGNISARRLMSEMPGILKFRELRACHKLIAF